MKMFGKFIFLFLLPIYLFFVVQILTANAQKLSADAGAKPSDAENEMLQPTDLFIDFPAVDWTMTYDDAKKAVEKKSAYPTGGRVDSELAWDGKFNGMDGRGTIFFKDSKSISQIGAIIYAMAKRRELFDQLAKKITEKHGVPEMDEETSVDISKLWKLKNNYTIELRLIKDDNSPVIEIHWVKR